MIEAPLAALAATHRLRDASSARTARASRPTPTRAGEHTIWGATGADRHRPARARWRRADALIAAPAPARARPAQRRAGRRRAPPAGSRCRRRARSIELAPGRERRGIDAARRLVDQAAHGRVDRLVDEELQARAVQRAQRLAPRRTRCRAASRRPSRPRARSAACATRSGVPIQHSAPTASIAARPRSVARRDPHARGPRRRSSAASARPRAPPAMIRIRATAATVDDRPHEPRRPARSYTCE